MRRSGIGRTIGKAIVAAFISTFCWIGAASAQLGVSLTTERDAKGCVKITVNVTNGGANLRDVHLLVAATHHEHGKEQTVFGDPRTGQYNTPTSPANWNNDGINRHDATGAAVGGPGQPAAPNDVTWWQTWTNAAGGGAADSFSITYCRDRDVDYTKNPPLKGIPNAVVLTKSGLAGGRPPTVGWTAADKIPYEALRLE
jgi:hypothetical protein